MIVNVSSKFEKQYKRLPERIKDLAKTKESIFRANPYDARLKAHKLSGKDKECRAFWINDSIRIKFVFLPNGEVLFLEIGSHSIYK